MPQGCINFGQISRQKKSRLGFPCRLFEQIKHKTINLLQFFQFKLWIGDGVIPDVMHIQNEVDIAKLEEKKLQERNKALAAEVKDLKKGLDAVEERARNELGMIQQGETFYQIIKPTTNSTK